MINLHILAMLVIFKSKGFLQYECSELQLHILICFSYYILYCTSIFLFSEHINYYLRRFRNHFQQFSIPLYTQILNTFHCFLQVTCSYLQIYQEKIFDLLNETRTVELLLREHPKTGRAFLCKLEEDDLHTLLTCLDAITCQCSVHNIGS